MRENVYTDEEGNMQKTYSFVGGVPDAIKTAIIKKFGETGYSVSESPLDKQLVFTPVSITPEVAAQEVTPSGKMVFDFSKNTFTDTSTGQIIKQALPESTLVLTPTSTAAESLEVPKGATGAQAIQLAVAAGQKAKTEFATRGSTEVSKTFDFTKPYYGPSGLTIKTPGSTKQPYKTKAGVQTELSKSEWVSFQDVFVPFAAGHFYIAQPGTKEAKMLSNIQATYRRQGITMESVGYELGQRFQWSEKIKLGQRRWAGYFGIETAQDKTTPYLLGSAAYLGIQSAYLFSDTSFTLTSAGRGAHGVLTARSIIAQEGVVGGAKTIAATAAREGSTIVGSPTYLITGLFKEIPESQKLQIAQITGGALIGLAGARAVGVTKEGTPIGDIGQGLIDTGQKYVRYIGLTSKPGEREEIVASASLFNVPYYGAKLVNVRPSGSISKGIEVVYRGANIVAAGLIGFRNIQETERKTGKPQYALAAGRTLGEIAIFEYAFESQTIDKIFEQSKIYGGAQQKLTGLVEAGKVEPSEYGTMWSAIEAAPTVRITGLDYSIKPTTPKQELVTMKGFDVKPAPSADINARVAAKPDFLLDIKTDTKQQFLGDTKLEQKPESPIKIAAVDTRFDIGKTDLSKIDFTAKGVEIRPLDLRTDLKFESRLEPRLDMPTTPRLEPPGRIEPTKIEPTRQDVYIDNKFDQKFDTKVDNKFTIFDTAVLGAAFIPFLPTGEAGKGASSRSRRTQVPGQAKDLLSTYLGGEGAAIRPKISNPTPLSATTPKANILASLFGKPKKKKRR